MARRVYYQDGSMRGMCEVEMAVDEEEDEVRRRRRRRRGSIWPNFWRKFNFYILYIQYDNEEL